MNSEFGVFEHVRVKTTELPCWLNEVCKAHSDHIVTLLNEKELHNTYWSNLKSTSLNICLKIVWKTFVNNESWSEPWRYQNTCMIVGVIGTGLQSPRTNNFTHLRVEQVGGWPRTTLPLITASTMRFRCHWFMFQCCKPQRSKAAYSEDDNVNSVAPETSSEVKGPEADVGELTKADQEELQCHHAENHWKHLKTIENHGKACLAPYVVGFAAVVNFVQIEELSVQHVQACPCQNY